MLWVRINIDSANEEKEASPALLDTAGRELEGTFVQERERKKFRCNGKVHHPETEEPRKADKCKKNKRPSSRRTRFMPERAHCGRDTRTHTHILYVYSAIYIEMRNFFFSFFSYLSFFPFLPFLCFPHLHFLFYRIHNRPLFLSPIDRWVLFYACLTNHSHQPIEDVVVDVVVRVRRRRRWWKWDDCLGRHTKNPS